MRRSLFLFCCLCSGSALFGQIAENPHLLVELRLFNALFRGDQPGDTASDLSLVLRRTPSGWLPACGTARNINHNVHIAKLSDVTLTDSTLSLKLDLTVFSDARGAEGRHKAFTVTLSSTDAGIYTGDYTDGYLPPFIPNRKAEARCHAIEPPGENFTLPRPDEHPRILFRSSDLPELRKKARTPLGKAALAAMDGPVGLAFRYQLTGRKHYARDAIPLVEKLMARGLVSDQYGNNVGDRLERTALAYDMCFDAWPEAFRQKAAVYMKWAAEGILSARRDTHQAVNWHVCSNWSSPLYTGAAFAGLALWGKCGPIPEQPPPTNTGRSITPVENCTPGRGVPVFDFKSGAMSPDWIFAGGFKTDDFPGDPLQSLGGIDAAQPQVGDEVTFGGKTVRFAPLPEEKDKGFWRHENYEDGKKLIDVTNAIEREYFSTSYFYIVLRNDKKRWVQFKPGPHDAVVYLSGVRLERDEVARLKSGLHPMLVETYIDQINPWGRQLMRPSLVELPHVQALKCIKQQKTTHENEQIEWIKRIMEWEQFGGLDLACRDLFLRSRHMMYLFCREAVGTGGFQAELTHYSGIAEKPPARYMSAHLQMFGTHVSPQEDIEALLPRKMFVHVYPEKKEPWAVEINGTPQLQNELLASLYPVVSEKLQPVVKWGWHKHTGFTGANWQALSETRPVLALLYYPLSIKPAAPSGYMPLAWRADDFGFYGFRNRWRDANDFIFQVFAKAHYVGGWNAANAGTFRLVGLGHVWAAGSTDRNRHRWEESVVQLPDNQDINTTACGYVTYVHTEPDGSGVVTIDYTDVYCGRKLRSDGRKGMRLYSRYGTIRRDDAFVDLGIRGIRSVGVDYSGKSGAPCLVACVDRVEGGGGKVWTWQLPHPGKKKKKEDAPAGDVENTKTEGSRFLVRKPDGATFQGVFAGGHKPTAEVRMSSMKGKAGSSAGKTLKRPIHGIFAESGKETAAFFFVGTIQKGPPPEIHVRGKGLTSVITIGNRKVRFVEKDGEHKIVFE